VTTPSSNAPVQNRNLGVNIVRGFLILGVVLVHLWSDIRYTETRAHDFYVRFGERAGSGEWSRLPTSLLDIVFSGGYLIPSFMMLSGVSLYLSTAKYGGVADVGAWMYRRMRLLLVPYWFGVGLFAAAVVAIALLQMALHGETLMYQLQHVTESKYDYALQGRWETVAALTIIPRAFNDDWLMVPPGILWFVVMLIQYYLVFPVLFRFMNRVGPPRFLAFALATTIASKLILIATVGSLATNPAKHISQAFIPFRWYEFALGMVVGYLLANRREALASRITPPAVIALLVVGGLSLEVTGMLVDVRGSMWGAFAAPLIITGMVLVFLPLLTKQPGRLEATWPARFFAFCGPLSFAISISNEPLRLFGSFLQVEEVPTLVWWAFLAAYIPLTVMFARPVAALLGIGPRRPAPAPHPAARAHEPATAGAVAGGS
jgi:peptidoglycan/LPS O-acetylase OafA/YrhL